jgi:hypothetical protein
MPRHALIAKFSRLAHARYLFFGMHRRSASMTSVLLVRKIRFRQFFFLAV